MEEKLNKIDDLSRSVDRISHDVENLKVKIFVPKVDESIKSLYISMERPTIKITSIIIVVKIVLRDKIHIYGITIFLNQSRQRHIIKINRSILLATNFIRASTFSLKVLISSTELTFFTIRCSFGMPL